MLAIVFKQQLTQCTKYAKHSSSLVCTFVGGSSSATSSGHAGLLLGAEVTGVANRGSSGLPRQLVAVRSMAQYISDCNGRRSADSVYLPLGHRCISTRAAAVSGLCRSGVRCDVCMDACLEDVCLFAAVQGPEALIGYSYHVGCAVCDTFGVECSTQLH